ncbi:bcl-2-like protein 2 isoform X1 [Octopus sinensis]|uniref:Bcl-2-like protein 2 isoform X1 n=1 Tax=Octopus sinensis TaxID=2607531 RepID=A0A6P7STS6_9MOLL|nr:bcl-2-like protein 2 isoform X1 [Octopus sinensis]XP_036362694.1 bcl-2-like protein 2 isoform X1 [Octopus sinensis]XP_036362695.1 bcl-2-like protein 2 isoform X1 [Octopus sinensis]
MERFNRNLLKVQPAMPLTKKMKPYIKSEFVKELRQHKLFEDAMGSSSNNNSEMNVPVSRYLLEDYVNYRLRRQGFTWENCPCFDRRPSKVAISMRAMADEFEERYHDQFSNMCQQLHITQHTAYCTFQAVINELFSDQTINWGRIVALFSFSGALSLQSVEKEMPYLVDNIVEWAHTYLTDNLNPWINAHGGWDGFVEFYESGRDNQTGDIWPSLRNFCVFATGALGFLTLGAFLAQKS